MDPESEATPAKDGQEANGYRTPPLLLLRWRHIVLALVALLVLAFPGRGIAYRLSAEDLPDTGPVKIGTRYKYDAYLHCGITDLWLGDILFEADEPLNPGDNPPFWWWGGYDDAHAGTVRQTSADTAVFTGTNGLSMRFTRIPVPANYAACD